MKAVLPLPPRFDQHQIERDIDDELRFHLDLLTEANLQLQMSPDEARQAALGQFGDFKRIKDECTAISRRRNPIIRALKCFLILLALSGVFIRVSSVDIPFLRVGDLLIALGLLGRLLLYVREMNPAVFRPRPETSSPLMLNPSQSTSVTAIDEQGHTPVERVIFDK